MTAAPKSRPSIGSLVFTIVLWLIACVVLIEALRFRYPANLAPLLLGGAATALLTVLLAQALLRFVRVTPAADARPTGEAAAGKTAQPATGDKPQPVADPAEAAAAAARAFEAATSPGVVGTIMPDTDPAAAQHEKAALLWTIGSMALLLLFGFLVGMTAAMLALLRVYGRESWLMTLLTTTLVMVTLYVAFGIFLRIAFFPGVIPKMLGLP